MIGTSHMTLLSFDTERLGLLRRALAELASGLERAVHFESATHECEAGDLVRRARSMCVQLCGLVEASLADIASSSYVCTLEPVADMAHRLDAWTRSNPRWWTGATHDRPTMADSVLHSTMCSPTLDESSGNGVRAGDLIDGLVSIEALVFGAADLVLVEELWRTATDPMTTSPHLAGQRIRRLLDVVFDRRPWERRLPGGSIDPVGRSERERHLRLMVARLVAPWQSYFTGLAREWGWSPVEGARRLHQIARLDSASEELERGLAPSVFRLLSDLPANDSERSRLIDDVALSIGAALEIGQLATIDRGGTQRPDLQAAHTILSGISTRTPWPLSLALDAGSAWLNDYFDSTDDIVRRAILHSVTSRELLAAVAMAAVWTSYQRRSQRSSRYTRLDDDVVERAVVDEMRSTYQAISNAATRGQVVAQLAH